MTQIASVLAQEPGRTKARNSNNNKQYARAPYLYISTCLQSSRSLETKRQRLQRISRALEVNSSTSLYTQHASTSTHLRRISRPPGLLRQTPTRRYTRSTPPHLHACGASPASRALEANSYMSLHPQHTSTSTRLRRTAREGRGVL